MESTTYTSHSSEKFVNDTLPNPQFGKNVRRLRSKAGVTQEELGQLSGLDRAYISGIERGVRNPTIVNVEKIANALQVGITQLFN